MFEQFVRQYLEILKYASLNDKFIIGTLGPSGTSSYEALQYFLDYLNHDEKIQYDCKLYDTFDEVLDALLSQQIIFALVPSAYCDITKYFWNPKLKNVMNFIHPTPKYGIASKIDYTPETSHAVKISTCKAVECFIDMFFQDENIKIIKVIKPSTTKSLEALLAGEVELAVTNETSFEKYSDQYRIKFITEPFDAQMVWSLFALQNS